MLISVDDSFANKLCFTKHPCQCSDILGGVVKCKTKQIKQVQKTKQIKQVQSVDMIYLDPLYFKWRGYYDPFLLLLCFLFALCFEPGVKLALS